MSEQVEVTDSVKTCMNCGSEIEKNYCSQCGQATDTGKLKLKTILSGVLEGFIDFDKPLYRTLIGLTTNPGKIIGEYVDGKRKSFTNPVKYVISTSALLVLVIQFRGTIVAEADRQIHESALQSSAISDFLSEYFKFIADTAQYSHIFTLLHMPIMALLFYLFFRKSKHTFTDHMAFGCFVYGHLTLLNSLLLTFNLHHIAYKLVIAIQNFIPPLYIIWSSIGFNRFKIFSSIWRTLIAYYLFIFATIIILFLTVYIKMQF